MKNALTIWLALLPLYAFCQGNSDVWLVRIDITGEKIYFTQPENITSRNGYDNQPVFSPDSKKIYFTSQPEGSSQTDIYSYDIAKKQLNQFTFSKTSEFSPAVVPGGRGISVVMVEEDSTQRIWEFDLTGKKTRNIFPYNDSVGYYSWLNANAVIAYILGNNKEQPSRLSMLQRDGREKMLAENVARGMKTYGKGVLYLKITDSSTYVYYTDFTTTKKLVRVPGKSMDMTIVKEQVLMAYEGLIYAARIELKGNVFSGLSAFTPVADLSGYGLNNMSRMAVSADGRWLAVVNVE